MMDQLSFSPFVCRRPPNGACALLLTPSVQVNNSTITCHPPNRFLFYLLDSQRFIWQYKCSIYAAYTWPLFITADQAATANLSTVSQSVNPGPFPFLIDKLYHNDIIPFSLLFLSICPYCVHIIALMPPGPTSWLRIRPSPPRLLPRFPHLTSSRFYSPFLVCKQHPLSLNCPTQNLFIRMASTSQLKTSDLFSVKGYVCVVTGGGTGIGLMCTQALAANGGCFCVSIREFLVSLKIRGDRGENKDLAK